jgi:predicted nucleic acid-binding protein
LEVVSDTSPIRALNFLGELSVLRMLFDRVLVPPAVNDELTLPLPQFAAVDLLQHDFIEIRSLQSRRQVQQLLYRLDLGESEALALALEARIPLVLMDEKAGRQIAAQHGIVALGTLGILLRAKRRGHFSEIRPLIEQLDELKFFMSSKLKESVLRLAGE